MITNRDELRELLMQPMVKDRYSMEWARAYADKQIKRLAAAGLAVVPAEATEDMAKACLAKPFPADAVNAAISTGNLLKGE